MKNAPMRLAVVLVLLASVALTAGAANKSRVGTAAAQELLIPVGARTIAIGGSSMAFANGVESIYWNPAGLGRLNSGVDIMLSNMNYFADIGVLYGAIGIKAGDIGNFGVSLKSLSFGDIPVTTVNFEDGTGQVYSPTFITFGLSYAKALTDRISVGLTTNIVTERIMELSSTGVAVNVGIQYQNLGVQGLDLGVAVKNIGPNMKFSGSNLQVNAVAATGLRGTQAYLVDAAASELPSTVEIGLAYSRKFAEKNQITLGGLFRNNNQQDDEYNLGAEYGFSDVVFLRGGYTFAPQSVKDVTGENSYIYDYTVGVGLHYPVGDLDLSFDYAYRHMKYFNGNNIVTLRIGM